MHRNDHVFVISFYKEYYKQIYVNLRNFHIWFSEKDKFTIEKWNWNQIYKF